MKQRRASFAITVALLVCGPLANAVCRADGFFFHDGDRAVILGDSITQQRKYSELIESYVLSRFPQWRISFRNLGWSADNMGLTVRGGMETSFARDLAGPPPTAVTIEFGMNDARAGEAGYPLYLSRARQLADRFAGMGARVAFISPSAEERYEPDQPAGSAYNKVLGRYSEGLRELAGEEHVLFIDQLNPMTRAIDAGRAAGVLSLEPHRVRLIPDSVHPGWAGHLLMAATVLKGLNAPAEVSSVDIDGASDTVVRSEGALVSYIAQDDGLAFTRTDVALPWPTPSSCDLALQLPGFKPFDELSRYILRVRNLTQANYDVAMDGQTLGTFTREQLSDGINLSAQVAALPQCQNLLTKIIDRDDLEFRAWRQVKLVDLKAMVDWIPLAQIQRPVEIARAAELKRLAAAIARDSADIEQLRRPQPHRWTVTAHVDPVVNAG